MRKELQRQRIKAFVEQCYYERKSRSTCIVCTAVVFAIVGWAIAKIL